MTRAPRMLVALLVLAPVLGWSLPARAQETTTLKASYRGQFLPEGTAVVVLRKPAALHENDLYQPEFIGAGDFPRSPDAVVGRDTLDARQQTRRGYPKTQVSGDVYFLYALGPDSTLYASFSASMGAMKFDVVDRGVMAVAPVEDAAVRAEVVRVFFGASRPPDEDRVVVYMRGDSLRADSLAEAARLDSLLAAAERAAQAAPAATPSPATAAPATPVPAARIEERSGGIRLSTGLFFGLLVLVLGALGALAFFALAWRRELHVLRRERMNLFVHQAQAQISRNRPDLAKALDEAKQARQQVEQEYAVLRARYYALLCELEALRSGEDDPAPESGDGAMRPYPDQAQPDRARPPR